MSYNTQIFLEGESIFTPEFRQKLNTIALQASSAGKISVGPGLQLTQTPGNGFSIALESQPRRQDSERLFAVLTSNAGEWEERVLDEDNEWVAPADPLSSVEEGPAYEINGREGTPAGTLVELFPLIDGDGDAAYWFDLGTGLHPEEPEDELGNPTTGGPSSSAPDENPLDNSWSRSGGTSVRIWKQTRTFSVPAGPVYAFLRAYDYDSNGHLYYISAETRIEVDPTEDCTPEEEV